MSVDVSAKDLNIARQMRAKARRHWYTGTMESLERAQAKIYAPAATEPELLVCLLLSKDKMHHSVGWWRNAEYEFCWHLSMSARDRLRCIEATEARDQEAFNAIPYEDMPLAEKRYWATAIFGEHVNLLWNEPGGTDPRLSKAEQRRHAPIMHLRMFLEPESINDRLIPWCGTPFIPHGEVYELTRWIEGLTPEKVDR